jgi:hypothetical protein
MIQMPGDGLGLMVTSIVIIIDKGGFMVDGCVYHYQLDTISLLIAVAVNQLTFGI